MKSNSNLREGNFGAVALVINETSFRDLNVFTFDFYPLMALCFEVSLSVFLFCLHRIILKKLLGVALKHEAIQNELFINIQE